MYTFYRVYMTPRSGRVTYGDEIDVSDYIRFDGLPSIKRSIDSTDFEIGVYSYDDLTLKALNVDGYFNDEYDSRSIFPFGRDRTKVRIVFSNTDEDTIVFRGLINEEATKLDPFGDQISFRVLSLDSVIRNTKVSSGAISNGTLAEAAIESILNVPTITSVLTFDASNINVDQNFAVEDGSEFDNKSTREVLNQLLLASNSVMLINDDQEIIIQSREADQVNDIFNLYGPFDIQQRTNIIRITNYNSGRHRMFTAVKVNSTEVADEDYITDYGYRQKKMTLGFVTSGSVASTIASRLMREFKVSKFELTVECPTYVVRDVELLDRVSFNYPLRVKPIAGKFLPIIGSTTIGDAEMPLPDTFGSLSIDPSIAFKVVEISENPKEFETTLKLRQIGVSLDDGQFNTPESCILGFAKIGDGVICAGGSVCDKYTPAIVGGGQIGCSEVA